jgi:hypothetical protein
VGRIIEWGLVSADGIVLDDPLPPGFRDYKDEAYLRDARGIFEACDAMLWGRITYERFAKMYPGSEGTRPYAARLRAVPKYVFSSKLQTAEWSNSTLIRGDVAAEVTRLKQHDGGDLLLGHGLLGETLLKQRRARRDCSLDLSPPARPRQADRPRGPSRETEACCGRPTRESSLSGLPSANFFDKNVGKLLRQEGGAKKKETAALWKRTLQGRTAGQDFSPAAIHAKPESLFRGIVSTLNLSSGVDLMAGFDPSTNGRF